MWRLRFLQPHEQSYNALRHLIAIRPDGMFLDVGANNGISTLSFRKFSSRYRILAIEPNPLLEPSLKRIKAKDDHFNYLMVGAGSIPNRVRFFVPTYNGVILHTATSANHEQVYAAIAHWFSPSIATRTKTIEFDSAIVRLDDLALEPSIIKIDAEGYDYDVLLGLSKTIERNRPFIMIEMEWAEKDKIQGFLAARRYRQLAYYVAADRFEASNSFDQNLGHNAFFIPAELVSLLPGVT